MPIVKSTVARVEWIAPKQKACLPSVWQRDLGLPPRHTEGGAEEGPGPVEITLIVYVGGYHTRPEPPA